MYNKTNKKQLESGTVIKFLGGNNKDRIGGNCSVIEHVNEKGETARIMQDLGYVFTPYESGYEVGFPNVDEYFDRIDKKTGELIKAAKPLEALFLTHAHKDHVGALTHYSSMGYVFPPIKTGRFTRNLVRLGFEAEGLDAPEIETIKPGDNIKVTDDVVVEAFNVAHSVVDSLGFHILTFVNDEPHAGIVNNGDFLTQEKVAVGRGAEKDNFKDLMKRKLVTHIMMDSTMRAFNDLDEEKAKAVPRLGYEKAVENVLGVIKDNPGKTIISPVISHSVQNIYIDIDVARSMGTKVYLEGKWLQLVAKAMKLSGYKDFDDVLYKGNLKQYMADKKIGKKYIVCTGAFAQGLQEYQNNQGYGAQIPMAAATKMSLDLHNDIKLNGDYLILSRQRIIDEINGKTGPQMLQMMAAKKATVVMTPSGKKIANFREVRMQDSGHLNAEEMREYVREVSEINKDIIYLPIHGNTEQCLNTQRVIGECGGTCFVADNQEVIKLSKGVAEEVESAMPHTWVACKRVFFDPLNPDRSIPYGGKLEYWKIDENYMPIGKFADFDVAKVSSHDDKDYYANQPEAKGDENSLPQENAVKNESEEQYAINSYTGKVMRKKNGQPRKANLRCPPKKGGR